MTNKENKKALHTPGPWTIHNDTFPMEVRDVKNSDVVAKIGGTGLSVESPEECEANARLIAAAPELLEALNGISDDAQEFINDLAADVQEGGNPSSAQFQKWTSVLSAIAKAEGGKP